LTTQLHLVPSSKNTWRYVSTPEYVFMVWCLVKHRNNFTLTLPSAVVAIRNDSLTAFDISGVQSLWSYDQNRPFVGLIL
jgi:hypothetical protein